jgi:uncharacterized protein
MSHRPMRFSSPAGSRHYGWEASRGGWATPRSLTFVNDRPRTLGQERYQFLSQSDAGANRLAPICDCARRANRGSRWAADNATIMGNPAEENDVCKNGLEPFVMTNDNLRERLKSLYAALKYGKTDFLLNSFDDAIEFISSSPLEAFPFLGHHRGKTAMAEILRAGYRDFEFAAYEPILIVCEKDDASSIIFARFIHRKTGRAIAVVIAHFLRFRRGRIVELREFMDSFSAVKQLLGREVDLKP